MLRGNMIRHCCFVPTESKKDQSSPASGYTIFSVRNPMGYSSEPPGATYELLFGRCLPLGRHDCSQLLVRPSCMLCALYVCTISISLRNLFVLSTVVSWRLALQAKLPQVLDVLCRKGVGCGRLSLQRGRNIRKVRSFST